MIGLGFGDFIGLETDATAIAPVRGGGGSGGGPKKGIGLTSSSQSDAFAPDSMHWMHVDQPSPTPDYFL